MRDMRLFCLTTCALLWSTSASDIHGSNVQIMMLKALQQVRKVPIILSVARTKPKRHRASASEIVELEAPPDDIQRLVLFPILDINGAFTMNSKSDFIEEPDALSDRPVLARKVPG